MNLTWLTPPSIWCVLMLLIPLNSSQVTPIAINITISAEEFPFNSGEIAFYKELTIPANSISSVKIDFKRSTKSSQDENIAYGILQVHACLYNVSLSYNATLEPAYHQTGSNLGLIVENFKRPEMLYIHNKVNHAAVDASIVFIPYNRSVPVPGGCSMELRMKEVPILILNMDADITTVDTPLASTAAGACNVVNSLSYTGYHLYLKRSDFTCRTYFDGLHSMITVNQLQRNGHLGLPHPTKTNRRSYSTVPGTGVVFATLVADLYGEQMMAAYVPAYSIACSPLMWETDCNVFSSPYFHVFTMVLIAVGIVRAYLGTMLKFIGMTIDGFIIGAFAGFYIEYTFWPDAVITEEIQILILISSGVCLTVLLATIWFCLPAVQFIVHGVTNIIVGYILAAFVTEFVDTADMKSSTWWYEFLFLTSIVLVFVIFPPWSSWNFILLSAAWGAFAIVHATAMFFGSNMPYVLVNTIKTVRVKEFRYANSSIPFEFEHIGWLVLWVILFVLAVRTQQVHLKRRILELAVVNESTPIVTRWTYGSDDVFESPNTNSRFFERLRRMRHLQTQ